ncbi:Alg9-like mannosyltransferase family-domain-containing protein [Lophiotrema nucula]|uniref:Mannosyltransferase n=1 Tax=Lophiotrema nucula TaxID=690887 RepID=A0A6A5ZER0_9PLEO|nr:Alg9-like mannosyltransferase family-domain-containing protein [Lophiotrema nucula]
MPPHPPSKSARATIPSSTGASPRSSSSGRYRESTLGVLGLLVAFRIVNALTLRTFFQPDEFFQSLEPAWQLAFGQDSNAWITWEWRTQLRSSLHPEVFAGVYFVAAKLATLCGLNLPSRAELFIAAPRVAQAISAALLDHYTWKLAGRVYGRGSRTAFTTLALSICSPWQWFCSTRTLSNCVETTLTAIACYYWPCHWLDGRLNSGPATRDRNAREFNLKQITDEDEDVDNLGPLSQLRLSLLLAAFACILRPTNSLIWLATSIPSLWRVSSRKRYIIVREILFCGLAIVCIASVRANRKFPSLVTHIQLPPTDDARSGVLACSVLSDRIYYQVWTLPPLRFLYFNIAQSLAVFYGKNRPDYYLTEGLPLLLTTALPFAIVGTWQTLRGHAVRRSSASSAPDEDSVAHTILSRLAWTSLFMTLSLSLISHKEVRFLYPVLPFLHVISAGPLSSFLAPPLSLSRRVILSLALLFNLLIAGYASQVHQRGVIDVLSYLRHKHEARIADARLSATTIGFLMPCHSTPWRSHLVHPGIDAWALTCEPPLDVPLSERASYLDEADQFYKGLGPVPWLKKYMDDTKSMKGSRSGMHWASQDAKLKGGDRRPWPQNVVFFEQLEPKIRHVLKDTGYRECWRGFNTHFHDDWRRKGDVVVWCND